MPLSFTEYLVGLLFFAATTGSALFAAVVTVRKRFGTLIGVERFLAGSLLFTAALVATGLLPAAFGMLNRWTAALCAIAIAAVSLKLAQLPPRPKEPPPARPSSRPISWLIAAVAVAAVAIVGLSYLNAARKAPPGGVDALTFHLPDVAAWMQSGSIWQIDQFVPHQAHGNYPNNGDIVLLSAVLPWSDDFALRFVFFPWLALSGVAVYALARELRAPTAAAVTFAAMIVSLPNVLYDTVISTLPDPVMLATFTTGLLFLLRHARTGAGSDLVLAGLGLGIAAGTKWFGFSSVVAVVTVWTAATLWSRRDIGRLLANGGVLIAVIAAAGGIWFLRNLILSGNPVFPAKVAPFGITIFDAPRDTIRELVGFSISDYAGEPQIWFDYFFPAFDSALGIAAIVLALGVALAATLAIRRLRRHDGPRTENQLILLGAATVVVLLIVYALTPYTAFGLKGTPEFAEVNVRYAAPAIAAAAAVAAWTAGRFGSRGWLIELAALVAVVDGLRRGADFALGDALPILVLAAAGAGLLLLTARRRLGEGPGFAIPRFGSPRLAAGIAGSAVLLIAAAGFYRYQRSLHTNSPQGTDPTFAYVRALGERDVRVGITGNWNVGLALPVAPMFGVRLQNEVDYVGPWVEHMLRRYRSQRPFVADAKRRDYDLLLVGRGRRPLPHVVEERWTRAAGLHEVARSENFTLFARPAL